MSNLTETEVLDRHRECLGDAKRACTHLGSQLDPDKAAPRGWAYGDLKRACEALEGSCRQMAHIRADARWLRLGVVYAKTSRSMQSKFVGQRWGWFKELGKLFELGERRLVELAETKTGVAGPILPKRASEWLIMPDERRFTPPLATRH